MTTPAKVLPFPTRERRVASAPESAKMLKAALHKAFPACRFSVRLSRGTGYGCAHVNWTDGPTVARVEPILRAYEG